MNQLQALINMDSNRIKPIRLKALQSLNQSSNLLRNESIEKPSPLRRYAHLSYRWHGYKSYVRPNLTLLGYSLETIKNHVAVGDIQEARRLVAEALKYAPGDEALQRLARAIAPPRLIGIQPAKNGIRLRANHDWMREHSAEYSGQWIALRDGQLLGAAPSFPLLRAQVTDITDVLITQIF